MFGFLKKELKLVAPINGKVIDLAKVPDPVFAEKMAGDGVAIDSTGNTIVAPCDGKISLPFSHAFGITCDNGIEILVHVGIDTVTLQGEGFTQLVSDGDTVTAGTPILKIDRALIENKGISLITPVLITNPDSIKSLTPIVDEIVTAGESTILTYKK
ncbi:MAG: PTS sugar transporter subunit IIA [Sarcina sp.]